MKKLVLFIFFILSFTFAADVKPFYFDGVAESEQQATWDELMKYKLWGTDYFSVGNGVIVPDESGRNGTNGNLVGTGSETLLGGPIIVTGDINVGNGYTFPSGPTVANTFKMRNLNNGYFGGIVCIADTIGLSNQVRQGIAKGEGELVTSCDTLPKAIGISIPTVAWPDSELHSISVRMHETSYLVIPEGEGPYDLYINGLTMNQESKLYIKMPEEGRLTRVFVNGVINLSNHAVIQTMYGDSLISNDDYGGTLMFYSSEDIVFNNTDYCIRQGTYISAKTFTLKSNVTFAGQLLAANLVIGDNVDGKNFLYVPFDRPILDIGDPKTNALGNFVENDLTVEVPIYLDTLAPVKVTFDYCFILNDNATKEDFNLDKADIVVCDEGVGHVIIAEGTSTPANPVVINVKSDGITEGTEVVGLKIFNVAGAALPGNKRTHIFTLTLSDGDMFKIDTDGIVKSVDENIADISLGNINVIGKTENTVITLADKDTARFALNITTGEVTLKEMIDYETENEISFTIIANDASKCDTANITIDVTDINENPIIKEQSFSFPEIWSTVVSIGNIITSDLDTNNLFTNNKIYIADSSDFIIIGNKIYVKHEFDYETDPHEYKVKVYVEDKNNAALKDSAYITINLLNSNEAPKLDSANISVYENYTGIVDTITANDPDGDKLSYSTKTSGWSITEDGILSITKPVDFESIANTSVTIIVTDGEKYDTLTYIVEIKNVNEPVHVNDTTFTIDENKKGILGKVTAWDEDNDHIYYTLADTSNYIVKYDGIIELKNPFDYETTKVDTIKIYVEDGNNEKDSAYIVVNINNVNEPMHIDSTSINILENVKINTPIDTIHGYDEDGEIIIYTVIETDLVSIKDSIIYLNKEVDYEKINTYSIKVIANTDNDIDTLIIPLNILNVNEPIHVKDTILSISENNIGEIGKVTAWDEDNDKISYIISDTVKYSIDSNGIITVKEPFDYETIKADTVRVIVTDGVLLDTASIIINICNVNEPLHTEDIKITIPENTNIGTILDTIHAYDEDGDKLKYVLLDTSIIKLQDSVIMINSNTDYENKTSYDIPIIIVSNNDRDTINVHIDITNVNEPLTVDDAKFSISENEIGPIGKVNAKDEDNDKIIYSISDTTIYSIDSNGIITVKVPFDYETKNKDTINVYVTDGEFVDTATIIVNIKNQIEKSNVNIDSTKTIDKIWYKDTIYTNDPLVEIYWTADSIKNITDTIVKNGPNIIELCYMDPSKDAPGCDTVVVYMSNEPPIVTVAKVTDTDASINGITIVDEPDGNQYVNKEINDIKVSVKDPTNPKNDTSFTIKVDLHTIDVPSKEIKNIMIYPLEEDMVETKHEVIGTNQIKVSYTDTVDNKPVLVSYITDSLGNKVNDNYTIEYTTKINGQEVHISYETDNMISVNSNYTISYQQINGTDTLYVSYDVDENGKIQKNKEGNVGYTISYSYTNKYGNTGKSDVFVILDMVKPVVEIISPINSVSEPLYTNSVEVIWTVDGILQDTLNIERLEKGINRIVRCYMDKADNISCDTILVNMKNAKDIDITVYNPVTEINKDKVDSFYNEGGKYNPKEPFQILIQDPITEELPEPVGIGLKVDLVLPSLSSTGGLATLDDIIQTVNGKEGILVNKDDVLISGTSTGADGSYTIPIDEYINEECNDDYKKDVAKYGLEHTPLWNVKYKMHIWIYNNNSEYVNDFEFSYNFNDEAKANNAGLVTFVVDWLADKDGYVKSADNNNLGTGAYLTKLETKSIAVNRCTLPNQPIGTKVKKSEFKLTSFGYKRPTK